MDAKTNIVGKVDAGIVTYNPDLERLQENLEAICPQVSRMFFFDNNSKNLDELKAFAEAMPFDIQLIASSENKGMAFALNQLCISALDDGATHILLLDQDSVASPDLVEVEASFCDETIAAIGPFVVDRNVDFEPFTKYALINEPRVITSGCLLNLAVFKEIGGYDERLFIDWVDFDYCINALTHGYRVVCTHQTRLLHELGHMEYVLSMPRRDRFGKVIMQKYYRSNHPLWRVYDQGLSRAVVAKKYRGTKEGFREEKSFWWSVVTRALLDRKSLGAYLNGYRDGKRIDVSQPHFEYKNRYLENNINR